MKLKNIASLMLAGVMAASMLAGCQNTSVKPEDPTDPIQPGTDGVSAAVETRVAANLDAVGSEIPEYVTFADDNDLDNALEYAVEYAGVQLVMPGYVELEKLTNWTQWNTTARNVYSVLQGEVGDSTNNVNIWNIGDVAVLQEAENVNSYQIDDEVAVELYAVSSAIGENAVNQMIAEQLYPGKEDYELHFNAMLPAFKDKRYMTVDGKLLFMVWNPNVPEMKEFINTWRELALKHGFNGFHFVGMIYTASLRSNLSVKERIDRVLSLGFDAVNTIGNTKAEIECGKFYRFFNAFLTKYLHIDEVPF